MGWVWRPWVWVRPQGQKSETSAERDISRLSRTGGAARKTRTSPRAESAWEVYVNVNNDEMHKNHKDSAPQPTYSIGDLAKEFDLTTRAIRFYEDMGLLEPQREGTGGRTRTYSARDRARLKLTLRAKRLGLSLTEAKEIIDLYESPRDSGAQLQKFLQVLAEHRQQLEERMQDIQLTLDEVRAQEKEAQQLLRKLGTREST